MRKIIIATVFVSFLCVGCAFIKNKAEPEQDIVLVGDLVEKEGISPNTEENISEEAMTEDEKYREEMRQENPSYAYKDAFESNIEFDASQIDVDLAEYTWFQIPENYIEYVNVYQWVGYAINSYYKENVPGTYTCNLPDDFGESITNMIFKVNVHGTDEDITLLLDMFNEKIVVNPED